MNQVSLMLVPFVFDVQISICMVLKNSVTGKYKMFDHHLYE